MGRQNYPQININRNEKIDNSEINQSADIFNTAMLEAMSHQNYIDKSKIPQVSGVGRGNNIFSSLSWNIVLNQLRDLHKTIQDSPSPPEAQAKRDASAAIIGNLKNSAYYIQSAIETGDESYLDRFNQTIKDVYEDIREN